MVLKRGFDDVDEAQKKYEEGLAGRVFSFFLSAVGDDAKIWFVSNEPYSLWFHWVDGPGWVPCLDQTMDNEHADKCPDCQRKRTRSFRLVFPVIDTREYTSPSTGRKYKNQLKAYYVGVVDGQYLKKKNAQKPLTKGPFLVEKKDKTYNFERLEDAEMTREMKDNADGWEEKFELKLAPDASKMAGGGNAAAANSSVGAGDERAPEAGEITGDPNLDF